MRRVHFMGFLLGMLLSVTTSAVRADDWAGPQTKEVFSASREYFVRVIPGESLGDTFSFAREKKGKYAAAEFYRRHQDRSYRLVAEAVLLNPMAPVEFFVSNDGHLATIDNWHNVGYGKVVSIYDPRGKVVQSYELSDLPRRGNQSLRPKCFFNSLEERSRLHQTRSKDASDHS
jgi:hypothetical protein